MSAPLLQVRGLAVDRGAVRVVAGIDLAVAPHEIVAVVGANGAGKSTLVQALMGLLPAAAGTIVCGGIDLTRRAAAARAGAGIGYVPEGRRVFPGLSTRDNLLVAAAVGRRARAQRLAAIYDLFPALAAKDRIPAWQLSGGQQQMLAIGRALMTGPRVLILDEPSQGLAPALAATLFQEMAALAGRGLALLVTEQHPDSAAIATRLLTLEAGRVVATAERRCAAGANPVQAERLLKNGC